MDGGAGWGVTFQFVSDTDSNLQTHAHELISSHADGISRMRKPTNQMNLDAKSILSSLCLASDEINKSLVGLADGSKKRTALSLAHASLGDAAASVRRLFPELPGKGRSLAFADCGISA